MTIVTTRDQLGCQLCEHDIDHLHVASSDIDRQLERAHTIVDDYERLQVYGGFNPYGHSLNSLAPLAMALIAVAEERDFWRVKALRSDTPTP